MYALVLDNQIRSVGPLPGAARRLDTGAWVLGLADADQATQQACGYYPVTLTTRPDPTPGTVQTRDITLIDGVPTETWTERPLTAEEQEAADRSTTADAVDRAIVAALADLAALVAAPAMPAVPAGTLTTAQLSNALRALRDEAQATRAGAQRVAATLANTIRLGRGDFDDPVVAARG